MSQPKRCDLCHYYQAAGKDYQNGTELPKGECRIQPPQPSDGLKNQARWPLVWADDWCGAFNSAAEVKANEAAALAVPKLVRVDEIAA